jgi:hypothetical protein
MSGMTGFIWIKAINAGYLGVYTTMLWDATTVGVCAKHAELWKDSAT